MFQELISFKNFWCAVFRLQSFSAWVPAWLLVYTAKRKNHHWKQWHHALIYFWEKYLISFQSFSTDPGRDIPNLHWCNYPAKVVVRYILSGIDEYSPLTRWGEGQVGSLEGMWAFHLLRRTNIFVIIIILFSTVFLWSNADAKLLFIFGYHPG